MSHDFTISVPTKDEIKEKTSEFWNKNKRKIVLGGVVVGNAALFAYLETKSSDELESNVIDLDPADYEILEVQDPETDAVTGHLTLNEDGVITDVTIDEPIEEKE